MPSVAVAPSQSRAGIQPTRPRRAVGMSNLGGTATWHISGSPGGGLQLCPSVIAVRDHALVIGRGVCAARPPGSLAPLCSWCLPRSLLVCSATEQAHKQQTMQQVNQVNQAKFEQTTRRSAASASWCATQARAAARARSRASPPPRARCPRLRRCFRNVPTISCMTSRNSSSGLLRICFACSVHC